MYFLSRSRVVNPQSDGMPNRPGLVDSEKFRESKGTTTSSATTAVSPTDLAMLPMPVVSKSARSDAGSRQRRKSVTVNGGLRVHWAAFKKRMGTGTAPSTSSVVDGSTGESLPRARRNHGGDLEEDVDEVIVDRAWADEIKQSSITQSYTGETPPDRLGEILGGTNTDHESVAVHVEGFWASSWLLVVLRWRVWPGILGFFRLRFMDEKSEAHYLKESWFFRKNLGIWSALFFILNWTLATAFVPQSAELADKIFYFAIGPCISFPVLIMVMFDFPRDRPVFYQIFLTFATWAWSTYQVLFMYMCGKYDHGQQHTLFTCGSKDFLSTFYYTSAMQTIALFGLNLNRFPAMIGAVFFFIVSCSLILQDQVTWLRNALNFLAFQAFLLYVHYMRENVERRLYTLRDQLKIQFKATQKAQVNERKAADSKRRLTSYVFHEVRVPLNTALLAVQNMDAYGAVPKAQEVEFNALEGSLTMMSKVLNDVLDFHRMDSGRFESLNKPYMFHQVMRSLFTPLRLDTDSRQLEFVTCLDPLIDDVSRKAYYAAQGDDERMIAQRMLDPNEDGVVVGDETRLRQIITNLAGNACKFTPAGGKITITTKLVSPVVEASTKEVVSAQKIRGPLNRTASSHDALSADHLSQHNGSSVKQEVEWIVVRIEVSDTGYGIQQKDMAQTKLFTAFNQTEQGRQQGGKGTGLGLALVRQIVKLSGGRLGVQSKVGSGSTFWVELPFAVGKKALDLSSPLVQPKRPSLDRLNSDRSHNSKRQPETPETEGSISTASRFTPASSTVLEHRTNPEGLVQLMPRRVEETDQDSLRPSISDVRSHLPSQERWEYADPTNGEFRKATLNNKPHNLELPRKFSPEGTFITPSTSYSSTMKDSSPVEIEPGMQVLVVDDDRMTRMLMERMLVRLQCVVITAVNGQQALKLLLGDSYDMQPLLQDDENRFTEDGMDMENTEEGGSAAHIRAAESAGSRFSIVFLDNQMPVMSGVEMVSRLRKMGRRDLVVGVTGNALLPDQEEYLGAGVDHVLTKPVREGNVRAMLAIAEERRKSANQCSQGPSLPPTPP